jgi:uncharacterized membrane protein
MLPLLLLLHYLWRLLLLRQCWLLLRLLGLDIAHLSKCLQTTNHTAQRRGRYISAFIRCLRICSTIKQR